MDADAFLAQIQAAHTLAEIAYCIDLYYEDFDNPTGGDLHNVLDDLNYEDDAVRFCIDHAESTFIPGSGARPDWHKEADPLAAALGRRLLTLTTEDRKRVNQWDDDMAARVAELRAAAASGRP